MAGVAAHGFEHGERSLQKAVLDKDLFRLLSTSESKEAPAQAALIEAGSNCTRRHGNVCASVVSHNTDGLEIPCFDSFRSVSNWQQLGSDLMFTCTGRTPARISSMAHEDCGAISRFGSVRMREG